MPYCSRHYAKSNTDLFYILPSHDVATISHDVGYFRAKFHWTTWAADHRRQEQKVAQNSAFFLEMFLVSSYCLRNRLKVKTMFKKVRFFDFRINFGLIKKRILLVF